MSGSAPFERTRLAWRRTVLSALAVALLGARLAIKSEPAPLAAILVALDAAAWLGLFAIAQRRIRRLDAAMSAAPARAFPVVVALVSGYVALSAVLVLRAG